MHVKLNTVTYRIITWSWPVEKITIKELYKYSSFFFIAFYYWSVQSYKIDLPKTHFISFLELCYLKLIACIRSYMYMVNTRETHFRLHNMLFHYNHVMFPSLHSPVGLWFLEIVVKPNSHTTIRVYRLEICNKHTGDHRHARVITVNRSSQS